jgi:hypothetical protein
MAHFQEQLRQMERALAATRGNHVAPRRVNHQGYVVRDKTKVLIVGVFEVPFYTVPEEGNHVLYNTGPETVTLRFTMSSDGTTVTAELLPDEDADSNADFQATLDPGEAIEVTTATPFGHDQIPVYFPDLENTDEDAAVIAKMFGPLPAPVAQVMPPELAAARLPFDDDAMEEHDLLGDAPPAIPDQWHRVSANRTLSQDARAQCAAKAAEERWFNQLLTAESPMVLAKA